VPGSREWLAHCGSMSKVLSPGLRVGWLVAQPELLAKATMCKQFSDAHTSTFAQATAAQYLKSGRMPATLANVRKVYAERAQAMGEALKRELGDAIEFTQPQGGLFFWARLTGAGGKVKDAPASSRRGRSSRASRSCRGRRSLRRIRIERRSGCRLRRRTWGRSRRGWGGWGRRWYGVAFENKSKVVWLSREEGTEAGEGSIDVTGLGFGLGSMGPQVANLNLPVFKLSQHLFCNA
jgi:hypothetical protein